jgi:methyl-accepting chemotaxis protein
MSFLTSAKTLELRATKAELARLQERSDLLDDAAGIGLWEATLHEADALHPKSKWKWSPEFRRLIGYSSSAEFPDVCQSWSDRLHPDDAAATFAAFAGHLTDTTGRARYDVTYRLKVRDGSYRWFRATGGCRHSPDGLTIRACGSLTSLHEQKTIEAASAAEAAADQEAISAIADGLAALAEGDLTRRVTAHLSAKTNKLKTDFNAAVDRLSEMLGVISGNAVAIRTGTGEFAHAADDLSRRTEQQAASLEQTAAALNQITATVKRTAEGSNHARTIVSAARADAEHSGTVVRDAVTAMGEIEKSSQQIGQIIGVIDEIAFQTNLLALNAGVEAARAGDAGRGFAVVASEVRALAQRSADAAKEIKALISTSTLQVSQGVKLVSETGQALGRIVGQVGEISVTIVEIARSAQEQATGLAEVNSAVSQMDQVTQQNAAMVEQSTAASHALMQEAEELSQLTSRFQLASSGRRAEPKQARKTGLDSSRPPPRRPPPPPVREPARKLAAVAEADGWTDF